MKKLTSIMYLASIMSFGQTLDIKDFKVNEPLNQNFNSNTKFDFEFKIKGDYSYATNGYHQIDLIVYKGNSTSSSNELGRIYWNREDDYSIIYTNYFTKTTWFNSTKTYSTLPGQIFTLKVKFGNTIKTYTYEIPKPDLKINLSNSIINSDCSNCDIVFDRLGTDRHYINRPTGIASLDILVENIGSVVSSATKVGLYISADNILQTNSDTKIKTFSLGSINPGSTRYSSGAIFASEIDVTTNFWLIIKLDDGNLIEETDENNNVFAIRFKVN
jgi:hypothetical protein